MSSRDFLRGHLPDVPLVVPCVRVVRLVDRERVTIVVDGDVDGAPGCHLDAERRAASAGESVDVNLYRTGVQGGFLFWLTLLDFKADPLWGGLPA